MNRTDLHIHSIQSNDGSYTPGELLEMAHAAELDMIAIADHNSIRSIPEALRLAPGYEMTVIPAIEIDCTYTNAEKSTNLHVLGYWVTPDDPAFLELEDDLARRERESSSERIRLIHDMGIAFSEEKARTIAHYGYVTGEVIAEIALADPANDENILLKPYRTGGSRSDNPYVNFYWDFCAPGKPAYVHIPFISLEQAIAMIRKSGGTPVLAHPANNVAPENTALLYEILEQGIAGIEAFSSYHTESQKKFYLDIAREKNLFFTAGSDFHGKTKPAICLGQLDCMGTEEEIRRAILSVKPMDSAADLNTEGNAGC